MVTQTFVDFSGIVPLVLHDVNPQTKAFEPKPMARGPSGDAPAHFAPPAGFLDRRRR
jgi:hypothetical protein